MKTSEITYAPVIIPTLCRYEHFRRCIESLQKNPCARYTELYIGLDYPLKESHKEGYYKIKEYLAGDIAGFADVHIYERKENLGGKKNGYLLKQAVFQKHEKYIYTEDDNEFSANFLEYMNVCLNKYRDDESVLAVSGFNYPVDTKRFRGNVYTSNVYFSAFGCGIWRAKEEQAREYIQKNNFLSLYKNRDFMNRLKRSSKNQYCNLVKGMLEYIPDLMKDGEVMDNDLACGIYMLAADRKMVFPVKSKVRNWGYDGSGVNCAAQEYNPQEKITHRNFGIACQLLDEEEIFGELQEETYLSQDEMNVITDEFFEIPQNEFRRTQIAYWCSRIFGINITRKLLKLLKIEKY